jgi:electron transfer flavoprotein-quinone oxidoreductase
MDTKIDVIVIGAGPCGIASAVTIARSGYSVVVIDRGRNYGSKNMFGGAVYLKSIQDLFPNSWKEAPYERFLTHHSWRFLTQDASTAISHQCGENPASATVFRPKFDNWMVENAKKEGVYFAPSTVVRSLILEKGKVIGVKTDLEEFYAPITIIAEGANALLGESIGLVKKCEPKDMILGIKEIIKLPKEQIEARFNIEEGEGACFELFGGLDQEILALGFLYTFKNHISIGLGVSLEDLKNKNIAPYELLEKLKEHKTVKNLIKDGELEEYSAHLIPDGGYAAVPKLYSDGVMLAGDCCSFVNPIHFEGTNLAIYSGIYAGETAIEAIKKKNYTKKVLKLYKKKMDKSFIMQDLKSYKNVMNVAYKMKDSIFDFYPKMMHDFFVAFLSANFVPKKLLYRKFIKNFLFSRKPTKLLSDFYQLAKTAIEVIK